MLRPQFFAAPLFEIFCNLLEINITNKKLAVQFNFIKSQKKFIHYILELEGRFYTFGILKGFFAAYSHNLIILRSFGEASCTWKCKYEIDELQNNNIGINTTLEHSIDILDNDQQFFLFL